MAESAPKSSSPGVEGVGRWGAVARFTVAFVVFVLVLSGLSLADRTLLGGAFESSLCVGVAWAVSSVMTILGAHADLDGAMLLYSGTRFEVIKECTSIELISLFIAATLAFPSTMGWKLTGIAAGTSILCVFNVLRVTALVLVGAVSIPWMERLHTYAIPSLLIAVSLGIWLWWAEGALRRGMGDLRS